MRANQPSMVAYFIEQLTNKKCLSTINMSKYTVDDIEKMDFSILKMLEADGVPLSKTTEGIMARREHQSIGIVLSIGISIRKFTEFLAEKLFNKKEHNSSIFKCKEFGKSLREVVDKQEPEGEDAGPTL
jgi:hypothetical protein